MRVGAPLSALPDQGDLGLALANHQALDERRQPHHRLPGDLAQRRPLVAEDPRIAVLVGPGGRHSHVAQYPRQQQHRVLEPRILGIGLDPLELGLGADALDLELGHEDRQLAGPVPDHRHRALGREEPESREVANVVLAEQHPPRQTLAENVLEEGPAARLEFLGPNSGRRRHQARDSTFVSRPAARSRQLA